MNLNILLSGFASYSPVKCGLRYIKYSKSEFLFIEELLCIILGELIYISKVNKQASDLGEKTSFSFLWTII